MREAYLDNSATTRVCPEAAERAVRVMTETYGNPSSLHTKGLEAERELKSARVSVARLLSCEPREVYFTSGGTEANNLALFGAAYARRRLGNRIVTTAIEHSSVLESALELRRQGFDVVLLPPGADGRVSEQALFDAVDDQTILISVMLVNNELGSIQPVEAARRAVRLKKAPALVHVDAVQAFGKIPVRPAKLGADLLSVSAHKIHGPKGVGALYLAKSARILPRVFGGEQEQRLRPGTEALPLIAGFGAAVDALPDQAEERTQAAALRDRLLAGLEGIGGVRVNSPADGLPYILNFSVEGIRSETMLHHLASRGVYVSSGSACAKGKQSHVLEAMDYPAMRIVSALRVSFSRYNTPEDVDQLLAALKEGANTLARSR